MFKDDCVFCKIVRRELKAAIVYEDDKIIAFNDTKPQAPIHVVIIPKYHIEKLSEASDEHATILGRLLLVAKKVAGERGIDTSGYRVVVNCNKDGGQEVFHLHLHLLGGRPLAWPPG